ncbi:hypothetical protein CM50_00535 [Bacillus subtilis]|nr:hypothetical protein CM50_00535 [Bacillus subtilis] [Bacillus stercoris]
MFHFGVGRDSCLSYHIQENPSGLTRKLVFQGAVCRRLLITVLALFAVILVIMLFADATRPALLLTSLWFIGLFLIYRARGSKKRRI